MLAWTPTSRTQHMFSDLSPEQRVPADHPLRVSCRRSGAGSSWVTAGLDAAATARSHKSRRRGLSSAAPPSVSTNHGSIRSAFGGLVVVVTMY